MSGEALTPTLSQSSGRGGRRRRFWRLQASGWRLELTELLLEPGADGGEVGEAFGGAGGGPGDGAEDEGAEEGVVEGPGVMAGDADEDAAFAVLAGPEEGLVGAVFW